MGDAATADRLRAAPLTLMLCLGAYLAYFDRALPSAGATLLKHELALSDAQLGFAIATAFALAYGLTSAAVGLTGAGAGRLRLACAGIAAWTVGSALLAFVTSFGAFVAAECLIGIGQALFVPAAVSAIANSAGRERLGRATARFTMSSSLGRSSAVLIAGLMIGALAAIGARLPGPPAGWRGLFLIATLPNLVVLVTIGVLARHSGSQPTTPIAVDTDGPGRMSPSLPGHFLTAVAPVMLIQAIGAWFPALLVRAYGLPVARAAAIAGGVTLLVSPLGQWLGGRLLDRHPRWKAVPALAIVPGLAIAGAALATMIAIPREGVAIGALVVADLALGVASLNGLAGVQALTPARWRHRANGVFFALITVVGVGLGPLLTGAISDAVGDAPRALALGLGWMALGTLTLAIMGHLLSRGALRYGVRGRSGAVDRGSA